MVAISIVVNMVISIELKKIKVDLWVADCISGECVWDWGWRSEQRPFNYLDWVSKEEGSNPKNCLTSSTTVRKEAEQRHGGHQVSIDWGRKKITTNNHESNLSPP